MNQVRHASRIVPHGKGGRSSVGGSVATVFGSTGYLGRYLVQRLGREGSQVICPYRGCELKTRELRVMGDLGQIHFSEFGILDEPSIAQCLPFSNVAINLAGEQTASRHFTLEDVNVDGARNIARAAREAGIERFVHVSALGADVDSPSAFLRSKALGEEAVKEEFPEATIIRPSNIFGPEDNFISRLADLSIKLPGPFPLLAMGEASKAPVYVSDVAAGIVATLADPAAVGTTYEFAGPKAYTMEELINYISASTRKPVTTIPIPDLATPAVMVAMRLAGMPRLKILPNEEEFYQYSVDDVVSKKSAGLGTLGVAQTQLESVGLTILRRYRSHLYHDDIDALMDEAK